MPSGAIVQAATALRVTTIPLISNRWVRHTGLTLLGCAMVSWAHNQVHRTRVLTPLPLSYDWHGAILPPFLPDHQVSPVLSATTSREVSDLPEHDENENNVPLPSSKLSWTTAEATMTRRMQQHVRQFLSAPAVERQPFRHYVEQWLQWRRIQQYDRQRAQRQLIFEQLIALQALKKQAQQEQEDSNRRPWTKWAPTNPLDTRSSSTTTTTTTSPEAADTALGYALVTGASRGIGRALAVQLARWEIPLVLVARDVQRLTALAYDLKACYGIACCVLPADLSQAGAAEQVYRATQRAGLKVDILVNNAGYSMQGLAVDQPLEDVQKMVQLNALSVSTLTHLFGRDMKKRRRGRILMVSSICGGVAGLPSVAVYAATKAFENTLGLSLAQELEPYGVGVTCLMPGAVRDTDFRARSGSGDALCWKLPFYPLTPYQVAKAGIRALLRGDTECTPGWQNRVFLKVLKPALPQRLHNIIAETAWNPLSHLFERRSAPVERSTDDAVPPEAPLPTTTPLLDPPRASPYAWMPDHFANVPPPRLLQLDDSYQVDNQTLGDHIDLPADCLPENGTAPDEAALEPIEERGSSDPVEGTGEIEGATTNATGAPVRVQGAREIDVATTNATKIDFDGILIK
jgi:uncharacterized protein